MSVQRGRPRDARLDESIIAVVEEVLLADGYAALNVDRVARLAATSRTAVYRRYDNRGAMVIALVSARFGLDPAPDTGDLERDLAELQRLQTEFFAHPIIRATFAGMLADVAADPALGVRFHTEFMAPRRASVAALLNRAAARGEIAEPAEPAIISDLLTGPLVLHACLPGLGQAPDALVAATVQAAMAVLKAQPR